MTTLTKAEQEEILEKTQIKYENIYGSAIINDTLLLKIGIDFASQKTAEKILDIIKHHPLYPTKQWQELYNKIKALSNQKEKDKE